jgi:hypothetical protein
MGVVHEPVEDAVGQGGIYLFVLAAAGVNSTTRLFPIG